MKRLMIVCMAVAAVALLLPGQAATQSDISESDHDLSGVGTSNEICIYCHTPHTAPGATDGPLWNHDASTQTGYQPYASATLDSTPSSPATYITKLCLSCHDGLMAVDAFGGLGGSTFMTGINKVGPDMRDDHPISITYDSALLLLDNELTTPVDGVVGLDLLPLFGPDEDQLECASCHDVHGAGFPFFLRATNAGSTLCLNCHTK